MKIKLNSSDVHKTKFFDNTGCDITRQLDIVSATIKLKVDRRPTVDLVCMVDGIDFSKINVASLVDCETKKNVLQSVYNAEQMKINGFSRIN